MYIAWQEYILYVYIDERHEWQFVFSSIIHKPICAIQIADIGFPNKRN